LAKARWEDFTCRKNQAVILDGIGILIVPHFTQNYRDIVGQRSSYMIIERICIKNKSNDIIEFLIGQFD
jgi:hypothetical protein